MIHTDEFGEFTSFAELRHAYIDRCGPDMNLSRYYNRDEWDDEKLHISELGKCPRAQMLRLSGAPRKWQSPGKQANDALMYWQGNMIHALTTAACDWASILLSYEEELPGLPEGWTGHYDMTFTQPNFSPILWDGKTVRPNAFRYWYDWPKQEAKAQMWGYLRFTRIELGIIEYIDRGGSNTPWLCTIGANDEWVDGRMARIEQYRKALPELPDPLRPGYKVNYYKDRGQESVSISSVEYVNSWQCDWCDYTGWDEAPCHPELVKLKVGEKVKGHLRCIEPEHRQGFEEALETYLPTVYDPRAEGTLESSPEEMVVE